jgi:hypothetical protein
LLLGLILVATTCQVVFAASCCDPGASSANNQNLSAPANLRNNLMAPRGNDIAGKPGLELVTKYLNQGEAPTARGGCCGGSIAPQIASGSCCGGKQASLPSCCAGANSGKIRELVNRKTAPQNSTPDCCNPGAQSAKPDGLGTKNAAQFPEFKIIPVSAVVGTGISRLMGPAIGPFGNLW